MPSFRACPNASWSVRPSAVGNSRGIFVTASTQSHASRALLMSNLAWLCWAEREQAISGRILLEVMRTSALNEAIDNSKTGTKKQQCNEGVDL